MACEGRCREVRLPVAQRLFDLRRAVGEDECRLCPDGLREERGEVVFEPGGQALGVLEIRRGTVNGEDDQLAGLRDRGDGLRSLRASGRQTSEQQQKMPRRHEPTWYRNR